MWMSSAGGAMEQLHAELGTELLLFSDNQSAIKLSNNVFVICLDHDILYNILQENFDINFSDVKSEKVIADNLSIYLMTRLPS